MSTLFVCLLFLLLLQVISKSARKGPGTVVSSLTGNIEGDSDTVIVILYLLIYKNESCILY